MKKGMDAVIAKSSKRAPLFKRKLAGKLDSSYAAKPAKAEAASERTADATPKRETDPAALSAKLDDVLTRLAALEAKLAGDDDEGDDDMEDA